MIIPQYGIFAQGTHAHYFLELDLKGGRPGRAGPRLLPSLACAGCFCGRCKFCDRIWCRFLAHHRAPAHACRFIPFQEILGANGKRVPAHQHDVWILDQRQYPGCHL